jgi:hypothetical protein
MHAYCLSDPDGTPRASAIGSVAASLYYFAVGYAFIRVQFRNETR